MVNAYLQGLLDTPGQIRAWSGELCWLPSRNKRVANAFKKLTYCLPPNFTRTEVEGVPVSANWHVSNLSTWDSVVRLF